VVLLLSGDRAICVIVVSTKSPVFFDSSFETCHMATGLVFKMSLVTPEGISILSATPAFSRL
jgi:hypothetical protein